MFTQWVADNVNQNMATLHSKGTLHGKGIIFVSTPKNSVPFTAKSRVIAREQRVKVNELVWNKGVWHWCLDGPCGLCMNCQGKVFL